MRLGFKLCVRLTQGFCVRLEAEQRRICPGGASRGGRCLVLCSTAVGVNLKTQA